MLKGSTILITDGIDSFSHTFIPMTLEGFNPKKLVVRHAWSWEKKQAKLRLKK
jgi:hypothetical protein